RMRDRFPYDPEPHASSGRPVTLILPKGLEPVGSQFRIPHSVLDVSVTEIVLNRSGIVPFVRELEAAGVAQHVRVNGEAEMGLIPSASDDLPNRGLSHRTSALGREDVRAHRILAA